MGIEEAIEAMKYKPSPATKALIPSRQVARAIAFQKSFLEISTKYPGELRKRRRRMARALAKRKVNPWL